jgi:predicted nicotinamide N-methyase
MLVVSHLDKLRTELASLGLRHELTLVPVGAPSPLWVYVLAADRREKLDPEVVRVLFDRPPFWAMIWPAGAWLAKVIGAYPELVAGKSVLDIGSGSGVVAVAAARAGAARVTACDCDEIAGAALRANAEANGVAVDFVANLAELGEREPEDLVVAADLLYDPAQRPLAAALRAVGREVLVADCRAHDLDVDGMKLLGTVDSSCIPEFETGGDFRRVAVYATPRLAQRHAAAFVEVCAGRGPGI